MKLSRKPMKKVFFNDYVFYILKNVYEPAEDTFLLADNLSVNENDFVLDMGTGCGILGILAAKKARRVIAVDINPYAVHCAKMNAKLNGVEIKMNILQGDLFRPIKKDGKFDTILFNAPYLPSEKEEHKTWIEKAWAGGPDGRELIDRFLLEAPKHLRMNGRIFLVQSTLSEVDKTMQTFEGAGLQAKVIAEKKVAFEAISAIEARSHKRSI
jgi:release factor glutamine methyltransferase